MRFSPSINWQGPRGYTGQPRFGPERYSVRGISDVPIAPTVAHGPIAFLFPRDVFVTGLLLTVQSGDPADLAHLRIRIQDETFQDMISDGAGLVHDAPALQLHGLSWKPFALQRPVATSDQWFFTLTNAYPAVTTIIPTLTLFFEEPNT